MSVEEEKLRYSKDEGNFVEEKQAEDVEGVTDEGEVVSATKFEGTPEERRLVRKLDGRIMPLACILYLFACTSFISILLFLHHITLLNYIRIQRWKRRVSVDLDRTNLGNARLQGLPQDALGGDKTGVLFDWVNSAFFFSYVGLPLRLPRAA